MSFTVDAWAAAAEVRARIDGLEFLQRLETGELDPGVFDYYLAQDAHYLAAYARILAFAAARARTPEEVAFWATSAMQTVTAERALHAERLAELDPVDPSGTCLAYTGYLLGLATTDDYPVLVAGVLPCFWLYEDTGVRLKHRLGSAIERHPFADWINTYDDPAFSEACHHARRLADAVAEESGDAVVSRMHDAFAAACQLEHAFWAAPLDECGPDCAARRPGSPRSAAAELPRGRSHRRDVARLDG